MYGCQYINIDIYYTPHQNAIQCILTFSLLHRTTHIDKTLPRGIYATQNNCVGTRITKNSDSSVPTPSIDLDYPPWQCLRVKPSWQWMEVTGSRNSKSTRPLPDEITIFRGLFALDNLCTEALMPLFLETTGEIKHLGSRLLYMPKIS